MKIALVASSGADFVSSRLRFALFLKKEGIDVTAIITKDGNKEKILKEGIKVIEAGSNLRDFGLSTKISYAKELRKIFKKESFDIIHFYKLQPNIIGSFVAGITTKAKIVNHVAGLGIAFTNKGLKYWIIKNILRFCYKFNHFFFKTFIIYQNSFDSYDLKIRERTSCVMGSAVNESKFDKSKLLSDKENNLLKENLGISCKNSTTFLFVSRLLKQKGIIELIDGFIQAQKKSTKIIYLIIVGWSDSRNPDCINIDKLKDKIKGNTNIKFLGKRSDVESLISISDVAVLPTYYREGTPRFLLEGMAMAKPIITTNVPGCNHLVPKETNGQLIEPKSVEEIRKSLLTIMERDLVDLGNKSYELYKAKFSENIVYPAIYQIYKSL